MTMSFWESWTGAVFATFQIYFDFSGYSDMAVGLGLMFGKELPVNFNSPFKSRNVSELWRNWHMTLSRLLMVGLFTPISIALSRRFPCHPRSGQALAFYAVAAVTTMFLCGLWHGATLGFIAFGVYHGLLMAGHRVWLFLRPRRIQSLRVWPWAAQLITFTSFVIGIVFFKAAAFSDSVSVLKSMFFMGGFGWAVPIGRIPLLFAFLICCGIVFLLPNSQQIIGYGQPESEPDRAWWRWQPNWRWAFVTAVAGLAGMIWMVRTVDFVYYRF